MGRRAWARRKGLGKRSRYLQAINDGDIDALASLTTEGHMMISSGGPPLVGKMALVAGNFLRIYRKIDGAWFMMRDSFNSQQPRSSQ